MRHRAVRLSEEHFDQLVTMAAVESLTMSQALRKAAILGAGGSVEDATAANAYMDGKRREIEGMLGPLPPPEELGLRLLGLFPNSPLIFSLAFFKISSKSGGPSGFLPPPPPPELLGPRCGSLGAGGGGLASGFSSLGDGLAVGLSPVRRPHCGSFNESLICCQSFASGLLVVAFMCIAAFCLK